MNYLKKFEELKWLGLKETLDSKFDKAISNININTIKLKKADETSKRYRTYKSDVNIKIPIDGHINSTLYITKDSEDNNIGISLHLLFDNKSNVFKILLNKYIESIHGSIIRGLIDKGIQIDNYFKDNTKASLHLSKEYISIEKGKKPQELCNEISNGINSLLNQDWNEVKRHIDDAAKEIDNELKKQQKRNEEKEKKRKNLIGNIEVISDALIELEDMSILHTKKEEDGTLTYIYNIPGIKVESTNFSKSTYIKYQTIKFTSDTSKFILTDELISVMSAMKSFRKKNTTRG